MSNQQIGYGEGYAQENDYSLKFFKPGFNDNCFVDKIEVVDVEGDYYNGPELQITVRKVQGGESETDIMRIREVSLDAFEKSWQKNEYGIRDRADKAGKEKNDVLRDRIAQVNSTITHWLGCFEPEGDFRNRMTLRITDAVKAGAVIDFVTYCKMCIANLEEVVPNYKSIKVATRRGYTDGAVNHSFPRGTYHGPSIRAGERADELESVPASKIFRYEPWHSKEKNAPSQQQQSVTDY